MFEPKPDIRPPRTRLDTAHEVVTFIGLLVLIIWPLVVQPSLPQQIPIHFTFSGQPNNFGHRTWILLLPGVGVFTWLLLTGVALLPPKYYNYPVPITEQNAATQYTIARQLLQVLKLETVVMFLIIESMMISAAQSGSPPAPWPIVVLVAMIFVSIGIYLVKAIRGRTG